MPTGALEYVGVTRIGGVGALKIFSLGVLTRVKTDNRLIKGGQRMCTEGITAQPFGCHGWLMEFIAA